MDLWLPTSARPRWQCNVPGCEATFREDEREAYVRHVVRCAGSNRSGLEELSGEHHENRPFKDSIFDGPMDTEAAAWLRRLRPRRRRRR